jgi:hypothetical protein
MPQQDENRIPDFREFVDSLSSAKHEDYGGAPGAAGGADRFLGMKQHLLKMYEGVTNAHSFMDDNGQIFDCIPVGQQPSLKGKGGQPAAPPDLPSLGPEAPRAGAQAAVQPQLSPERVDRFGNRMNCPEGTVPVRRVTLEQTAHFEDLRHFFRKTPVGMGRHPRLSPPEISSGVHKYANAYQNADNLGGHSFLNIWDPAVGAQEFSLSQHWYAGGSPVQTVERGWQVYPKKYTVTDPTLFIYWTADGYGNTGFYNLEGPAFVQTNNKWALGGKLDTVSVNGGAQYELEVAWKLSDGNWWLYLNGTDAGSAVGYYPASLFGSGQLASNATSIDYGGETVNVTAWPPMGSGAFASLGYMQAAYHRDVYYFATDNSAQPASLAGQQLSENCYTISIQDAAAPWNRHFFFGGPGGGNCG